MGGVPWGGWRSVMGGVRDGDRRSVMGEADRQEWRGRLVRPGKVGVYEWLGEE